METDTQRNFKKQMKELEKQKDYKNKYHLYEERKPKKYRKIRNISISSVIVFIIVGYSLLNRINKIIHIPTKSFITTESTLSKDTTPGKNKIRDFIVTVIELRKTQGELINYSNSIIESGAIDEEQIIETTYAVKDYLKMVHEYRDKLENADVSGHMVGFKERNLRLIVSIDNYYNAYLKNLLNPKEKEYREIMTKEAKKINECIKIIDTELESIINNYNEN